MMDANEILTLEHEKGRIMKSCKCEITPPEADDDWADFGYDGAADADPDVVTLAVWTELDK
jgi:hypothetical protein